jgi:hypothetical protein
VRTLFREENLGCKVAVSSGITWFFEQVEEGIILEDDCLPNATFFQFCKELLDEYRGDERVMMVSGDNFQPRRRGEASYYFSRYTHIWGWATWRRAWRHYDLEMKAWPEYRRQMRLYTFLPPSLAKMAERHMDTAYRGRISTWDAQWLFACWNNDGVSVIPSVNLISNIDSGGTHMKVYDPCIHHPVGNIAFPMTHPASVEINNAADQYIQRYVYFRGWRQAIVLIIKYLSAR